MTEDKRPVAPEAYNTDYFLSECEGHEDYVRTLGRVLPRRLAAALAMAGDIQGLRVLDLGCGRGEVLRHALDLGARAVGLDFSLDALSLAREIIPPENAPLVRADVRSLPLLDSSFDLVFALDLVEHLYPAELEQMLAEVHRVLVPGGRLIVHTMPNIWYYRYGYPLFRLFQRLRGIRLPRDPRERWNYVKHVHVNEQSLMTLSYSLRRAGFETHVRLHNIQSFEHETSPLTRRVFRFLATIYPFAWVFCNDLFAVAIKEGEKIAASPAHLRLHDLASRQRKANKILAILQATLPGDMSAVCCLDVGCASGLITRLLAPHMRLVIGLEYDPESVALMDVGSLPNLLYIRGDAASLPLSDASVDLVLCTQVYEHVADAEGMVAEIRRVLRPGGVCLFSGPNRLDPLERHYGLPFLSWLPRRWADVYLRLTRRGDAYRERPRTYWGLKRLWRGFERVDFTAEMIRHPATYHCQDELGGLSWISRLPGWLMRLMTPFYPNYNWVLIKRAEVT